MATSFLPFLYPARLVQRPPRGPVVRHFLRSLHGTAPRPERSIRRPAHRDPIPFDLPPDIERDLLPDSENGAADGGKAGDGSQGTITPMERQAFRRIFREIAQRQKYDDDRTDMTGEDGDEESAINAQLGSDRRIRVNTIVSEASDDQVQAREHQRNQRRQRQESVANSIADRKLRAGKIKGTDEPMTPKAQRRRALALFPVSLRSAASKAMGIKDEERQEWLAGPERAEEGEVEGEETTQADPALADTEAAAAALASSSAAREARRKRQETMEVVMLGKKSDFALWDYMEENVFGLVDELGISRAGRAGAIVTPARQKKLSAKLTTYGPLYPALLLHGLRLLDSHFSGGQTSPLALAVLPRIKALGLASYVLGAGTPFYNHLMRIHWARYGDTTAVFALLQEMQRAGVAFDRETLDVLRSIEWHMVPLAAGRTEAVGSASGGGVFVTAAVQQLPELQAIPGMVAYWRAQVERIVNRGRR